MCYLALALEFHLLCIALQGHPVTPSLISLELLFSGCAGGYPGDGIIRFICGVWSRSIFPW